MAKQKIEIEIDIPNGYEFVRYGVPAIGEHYFRMDLKGFHNVYKWQRASNITLKYFIVRKVKQWRDPVLPADYGKLARFSDNGYSPWLESRLSGWSKYEDIDDTNWLNENGHAWKFCQVCDEEKNEKTI